MEPEANDSAEAETFASTLEAESLVLEFLRKIHFSSIIYTKILQFLEFLMVMVVQCTPKQHSTHSKPVVLRFPATYVVLRPPRELVYFKALVPFFFWLFGHCNSTRFQSLFVRGSAQSLEFRSGS